ALRLQSWPRQLEIHGPGQSRVRRPGVDAGAVPDGLAVRRSRAPVVQCALIYLQGWTPVPCADGGRRYARVRAFALRSPRADAIALHRLPMRLPVVAAQRLRTSAR